MTRRTLIFLGQSPGPAMTARKFRLFYPTRSNPTLTRHSVVEKLVSFNASKPTTLCPLALENPRGARQKTYVCLVCVYVARAETMLKHRSSRDFSRSLPSRSPVPSERPQHTGQSLALPVLFLSARCFLREKGGLHSERRLKTGPPPTEP